MTSMVTFFKRLFGLLDKAKHLDRDEKIVDLRSCLQTEKEKTAKLNERIETLESEVARLKALRDGSIKTVDGVLYLEKEQLPICKDCYVNNGENRTLTISTKGRVCPACGANYGHSKEAQERKREIQEAWKADMKRRAHRDKPW